MAVRVRKGPPAIAAAVRIAALQSRLRQLREGNPYQRNFHRFLTELCWTKDEASGGQVALFPDDRYNRQACDYLIEKPLTFWEKSRRVLMTWRVSGLDLWVAAGGQDPRWPALMHSTANRSVLIISKKEEDAAWVLGERVRFIYEELERRDIRKYWPEFPKFTFSYTLARGSNGSTIRALPQGEKQVHQYGATILHYEEVSLSEHAGPTVAAAIPVMLGKDGVGGHVVLICTPTANTWAADLRNDRI